MYPIIYIGPMPIPTYGLMCILAFLAAIFFGLRRAHLYKYPKDIVLYGAIFAGIGAVAGAKILYFITSLPTYLKYREEIIAAGPIAMMQQLFGGFVFYGGLIGTLIMLVIFCKLFHVKFLRFLNIVAPVIPLLHGIGRIGCFLAGCCYGIKYDGPLAVTFNYNPLVEELDDCSRFPVQLVEAGVNFILFGILYYYSRKVKRDGELLGIYLICYAVIRFTLEFFRGDGVRGFALGVSTSQWISIGILILGVGILVFTKKLIEKQTIKTEDAE